MKELINRITECVNELYNISDELIYKYEKEYEHAELENIVDTLHDFKTKLLNRERG